jgi:class 3 adenylate cyclase
LVATNSAIERFVPYRFLELLDRKTVAEFGRGDAALLQMSVMFCDLRGFTTLAESLGPEATFRFINEYLAAMEPNILSNGGFVNQYLGDGIMSLFHTSADSAVSSAARMAEGLRHLNERRAATGLAPLRIGIGIHTGPLMLGIIGGESRLSPGVVGDAVNVAARIEGMTKIYGVTALVSDVTRSGLSDPGSPRVRELDRVMAKGKTEPFGIHEILDADPAEVREAKMSSAASFALGLRCYRAGDFAAALKAFTACVERCPADGPARLFVQRLEHLAQAGPPAGWSGVTVLDTK